MNKTAAAIPPTHKGFTLIELLLVMLISSILILGTTAAYRQAHLMWSNAEHSRPIYQDTRMVTETLRQELSCLYFPPAPDGNQADDSTEPFEPISVEADELTFFTLTPYFKSDLESSRMAKVSYRFSRDQATGESVLTRSEQPYAVQIPIAQESSEVVATGLSDFRAALVGEGNSNAGQDSNSPPKALRISLCWPSPGSVGELRFQTTILIPAQQPLAP